MDTKSLTNDNQIFNKMIFIFTIEDNIIYSNLFNNSICNY